MAGSNSTVLVTGSNSLYNAGQNYYGLVIGERSQNNQMTISNGAQVTALRTFLGGSLFNYSTTAPGNRLERCKIKDPSVNNWPALVEAVQGNIIADFPVINKSFNLSYSGQDT